MDGSPRLGAFGTGGRGTGKPHLPSQSSIVLSRDGRQLLVVNAGSHELSLFAVEGGGLSLQDRVASGGATPTSVAVCGAGLRPEQRKREHRRVPDRGWPARARWRARPAAEPRRRRSGAGRVQPRRPTLAVTERGTDSISAFAVDERGYADGPATISRPGKTPYGFDFTRDGAMIVTEAFGGAIGEAAASSYALDGSGGLRRSAARWAIRAARCAGRP